MQTDKSKQGKGVDHVSYLLKSDFRILQLYLYIVGKLGISFYHVYHVFSVTCIKGSFLTIGLGLFKAV